jgi:phenylacetate-coenzyme A ligase PaaK-like adenylate-forming protein
MNARWPEALVANPLDAWISARLGGVALIDHQIAMLVETVAWAKQRSPFYRRLLADVDERTLTAPGALHRLPFTTADDLRRSDPPLLCVSQSDISHVVTLETSGTSGPPKRLFFTPADQETTIDFFRHGMSVLTRPGDRVAILFPGERPGSVGDLLATGLQLMGATPILAGWPHDPAATAALLQRERPDVVAGAPVAVLAVARNSPSLRVRSVLLSSDHVAASLRTSLADLWGCEVFEHYGMTEMGLGGGVDCDAHAGYHMREHELLVEVVAPDSGVPMAPGEFGEVVFTTLTRRGLPLIRYRTGDISRVLPGTCPCGSPLLRLDRIAGRIGGGNGGRTMAALDEALFSRPEVVDFSASYRPGMTPTLHVDITTLPGSGDPEALRTTLTAIPVLAQGVNLSVDVVADGRLLTRVGKRRITVDNTA